MSTDPIVIPNAASPTPPPWGLLATIAWGAAGICAWFAVQFAVIIAFIAWRNATAPGNIYMERMANDGFLLASVTIVAAPAWIGVSVIAARLRGGRARDYLGLIPPRRGEILFGIACLVGLLIGADMFTYLIG